MSHMVLGDLIFRSLWGSGNLKSLKPKTLNPDALKVGKLLRLTEDVLRGLRVSGGDY